MRNAKATVREKQAHTIQQEPHPLYAVTTKERGQCLISVLKTNVYFLTQHAKQEICLTLAGPCIITQFK